jgi:hypothetical protein
MTRALSLTTLFATHAVAGLVISKTGFADTADGSTPAEETSCDSASGVANGLCVAYCEATDCNSSLTTTADEGCNAIDDAFTDITGGSLECFADGGSGDNSCLTRCKNTATTRYIACEGRIVKKDTDLYTDSESRYWDSDRKLVEYERTTSGRFLPKIRDCETSVGTWLESCAARCSK